MYDNCLKSDIGFYGLSSVNLYDKGAKVAKLSSDDVALGEDHRLCRTNQVLVSLSNSSSRSSRGKSTEKDYLKGS